LTRKVFVGQNRRMTLLGFLRSLPGSPASLSEARLRLPGGLLTRIPKRDLEVGGSQRALVDAATEALAKARTLTASLRPTAFYGSARKDGKVMDSRLMFAAIAALYNEGYQPFVEGLVPPTDPEAEAKLSMPSLIEKVGYQERSYQEEASRWLIAAHFLEELLAFKEGNEAFFSNAHLLTADRAMEGVAILNKWWPWVETLEYARDNHIAYIDWKRLGTDKLRF